LVYGLGESDDVFHEVFKVGGTSARAHSTATVIVLRWSPPTPPCRAYAHALRAWRRGAQAAWHCEAPTLYGSGANIVPTIHAADLCAALTKIAQVCPPARPPIAGPRTSRLAETACLLTWL
jgi:hypothetical protein